MSVCEWGCEGLDNFLLTGAEPRSHLLWWSKALGICMLREWLKGGLFGENGIIRFIKNRNTWPCSLLFLVSLKTVLTELFSSQGIFFFPRVVKGLGTPSALLTTLSRAPSLSLSFLLSFFLFKSCCIGDSH